jgi:lipoprotein NlpI
MAAPAPVDTDALLAACQAAAAARDAAATMAACGKVIDTAGISDAAAVTALSTRARAAMATRDFAAARADLDRAVSIAPDSPELRFIRGLAAFEQGDNDAALAETTEAIRIAPEVAEPYRLRAEARVKLGQEADAVADFAAALQRGGGKDAAPAEIALRQGVAALVIGDAAAAVPALETAARLDPDAAPRLALWRNLAQLEGHLPSIAALNAAAEPLDPALWPAPLLRYYQGEIPEYEVESAAASDDPATGARQACDVTLFVAARALTDGSFPVAHDGFDKAVQVCAPGSIESDAAKALSLVAARDQAAGTPALEDMFACQAGSKAKDNAMLIDRCGKALAVAALPDAWRLGALIHRGQARFETGDVAGAVADADAALALKPDADNIYESRGIYRVELGEIEGGIADLSYALTLNPQAPGLWLDRAWARSRKAGTGNADWAAAQADFSRAVELDPNSARLLLNRGAGAWLAGDKAAAARDFAAVIDAAQQAPYAVLWLQLAVNGGQKDEADTLDRGATALGGGTAWPLPILDHLRGITNAQDLAKAAARAPDRETAKKQSCEAAFYAGMLATESNSVMEATKYLTQARNLCFKGSLEYQAAMVALGR